jgi:hypothetical protein
MAAEAPLRVLKLRKDTKMDIIIERFDLQNTIWIRAVLQSRTEVARLSNTMSLPRHQLYEVWLLPEAEPAFSPLSLEKACFNRIEEMVFFYDPEVSRAPSHACGKQLNLLSAFANNLAYEDSRWNYSVCGTEFGQVISVVFGSWAAMKIMYDRGLRTVP